LIRKVSRVSHQRFPRSSRTPFFTSPSRAVAPLGSLTGLPVPSLGYRSLTYHCNALSSFYTTLLLAAALHLTGLFRLPWLIESFGPLMSWSIIISFTTTLLIYVLATVFHYGGEPIRMSGSTVYDIFMGASLNPRLFTSKVFALGRKNWQGVDLKMFAEVRVPWVLLFLIAVSGGVKQYEDLGYITPVRPSLFPDTPY
jgi:delta24(24(1))-sterol reductase